MKRNTGYTLNELLFAVATFGCGVLVFGTAGLLIVCILKVLWNIVKS